MDSLGPAAATVWRTPSRRKLNYGQPICAPVKYANLCPNMNNSKRVRTPLALLLQIELALAEAIFIRIHGHVLMCVHMF